MSEQTPPSSGTAPVPPQPSELASMSVTHTLLPAPTRPSFVMPMDDWDHICALVKSIADPSRNTAAWAQFWAGASVSVGAATLGLKLSGQHLDAAVLPVLTVVTVFAVVIALVCFRFDRKWNRHVAADKQSVLAEMDHVRSRCVDMTQQGG
jgi:hypothetical protein